MEGRNKEGAEKGIPIPPMPEEPQEPILHRLMTQTATEQALCKILAGSPGGIFVCRNELAAFFAELEDPKGKSLRGLYLSGWPGDVAHTADTIGRGMVAVPHVCISLFGSFQPDVIQHLFANALRGGRENDGLMQRFQLLIYPHPVRERYTHRNDVPDAEAIRLAGAVYRRLALMNPGGPEEPELVPF